MRTCSARTKTTTSPPIHAERRCAPAWPTSISRPANSAPPKSIRPNSPAHSNPGRARSSGGCRTSAPARPEVRQRILSTGVEDWIFSLDYADRTLREHFGLLSLDGCGLAGKHAAISAAGAILHYLRDTQRAALEHLDRPTFYDRAETMVLDAVTVRNLELLDPYSPDEGATLIGVLDQTATGMGGRLLRQRLLRPSLDRAEIEARLDAVADLQRETILRADLRKQLAGVLDMERLLAKISIGSAGPREVFALGRSLEQAPLLVEAARSTHHRLSARTHDIFARIDDIPELRERILKAISDNPPLNLTDGGTIRAGYHAELDELRDLSQNGRQYIAQIEARERTRTGIQSLKIRFNNVFGYYIEISKANLQLAPADYERKQTLVNAERFTTPELKEYERKVLSAEEKILELEKQIFSEVRLSCRGRSPPHSCDRVRHCRTRRHLFARPSRGRESLHAPGIFGQPAKCGSWPDAIL